MNTPTSTPLTDRRPLTSRNSRVLQGVAAWLAARRVSPNLISIISMVAATVAGACLAATAHVEEPWQRALFVAAAAMVQLRLLCNLIDGLVAVEGNMRSPVGELYNEVPDRVSDSLILIGAGFAAHSWILGGFLAALLAMFTAYIRAMGKACGKPYDFVGPMAKPQRMFWVTMACIAGAMAPSFALRDGVQLGSRTFAADCGPMAVALAIIVVGCIVTSVRRLARLSRALRGGAA